MFAGEELGLVKFTKPFPWNITMVKVFSFCLYGPPNPQYYPMPMLQNISLIETHFPDWKVYLYIAPDVDPEFLKQLAIYSNVVIRPTGKLGSINMFERFFAIDEPEVEIMMVRDADSHVHWKDRWAINQFLSNTQYNSHIIRDNKEHTSKMMGGLWGMRKIDGLVIEDLYKLYKESPSDRGYGEDQSFLTDYVYPYLWKNALVHYSNKRRLEGENAVQFPFEYVNEVYCGRCDFDKFVDSPQAPFSPEKPERRFRFINQKLIIKT